MPRDEITYIESCNVAIKALKKVQSAALKLTMNVKLRGGGENVSYAGAIAECARVAAAAFAALLPASQPDCGACHGGGSICKTECRHQAENPPAGSAAPSPDSALQIAQDAVELMTKFHSEATPDETPEMNPVFPAAAFQEFVDGHARLMYRLAHLDHGTNEGAA